MARKFNLQVGDNLTFVYKEATVSISCRSASFKIAIIFDVGMYEYNAGFVFMLLAAAQNFFLMAGGVNTLEIMAKFADDGRSSEGGDIAFAVRGSM